MNHNNNNNNYGHYHGNSNSIHHQKSQNNATFFNNNNNNSNNNNSTSNGRHTNSSPTNKKYGRYTPPNTNNTCNNVHQFLSTPPASSSFPSNGSNKKRRGPGGLNSPIRYYISPVGVSIGIPNTHFNYSKVYDSPSAKTLPPPPERWTSISPDELLASEPKYIVESDEKQPLATIVQKDNGKSAIYIGSSKRCLFDVDRIQIGKSNNVLKLQQQQPSINAAGATRVSLGQAAAAAVGAFSISSNNSSDIFTNSLKLLLNIQA